MSMKVNAAVKSLVNYGLRQGLITKDDAVYARNQILERLGLCEYEEPEDGELAELRDGEDIGDSLEQILGVLCEDAAARGILPDDSITQRDLFDTKLMNCLVPRPGEVIRRFWEICEGQAAETAEAEKAACPDCSAAAAENGAYTGETGAVSRSGRAPETVGVARGPETAARQATDYFYKLSKDSDYIRRYRIKKDLRWKTETPYGELDITINLSKPEKDPRDIAAAKKMKQSGYPKCLLCIDNVGYGGRANHPARDNHRIIPLKLDGEDWGFQYSPYVYYNEHCIVFNQKHVPMKISDATFRRLFDFVKRFPHYILGSNADLPIVGGSILTHDHFQGGNYEFPMAKAPVEQEFQVPERYAGVRAGIVKWPLSVLRIAGMDTEKLCGLASEVLAAWRGYTDEAAFIFAETDGEPHNTITPIARCRNGVYELDLVLRNNITTPEHPMGVYHPHAKLHHIKKENIGLIEVMGLAVLPARLKAEMAALEKLILEAEDAAGAASAAEAALRAIRADEKLAKHADWTAEWLPAALLDRRAGEAELSETVRTEIGKVFCEVLEDAGVYKCTPEGRAAFARFLEKLSMRRV